MDLYVLMGGQNTRKSSTIRALTGVAQFSVYDISTRTCGVIPVLTKVQSLQEAEDSPPQFVQKVQDKLAAGYAFDHILLGLRLDRLGNLPDGNTYLQHFHRQGWAVREIVLLGTNQHGFPQIPLPAFRPIPNSPTTPANEIAAQIRQWWGWL